VGRTPGGRFGHAITLIDTNRFLVAGGSSTFPSDFLGDAWELNLDAAQWIQIKFTDDMKPRRAHSISYLQDRLYLFGGRNRYGAMLSNVESSLYLSPSCPAGNRIMFCELTGKVLSTLRCIFSMAELLILFVVYVCTMSCGILLTTRKCNMYYMSTRFVICTTKMHNCLRI
jgi:hypothetical protein